MQLLRSSALLFLTSCLALLPLHGLAQSRRSILRRATLPDLPYPPDHNAATCPRDRSYTTSLSFVPDTESPSTLRTKTKPTRAIIVPRARSGALPDVCYQTASFFFPALPYRYFRLALPPFLPGNVYVFSIRTPANKRIDEISARVVAGPGPPQNRLLDISIPMSSVGTLRMVVQARLEVVIRVVFQEGNTPGEIAMFALGTAPDPSAAFPIRGGTFASS